MKIPFLLPVIAAALSACTTTPNIDTPSPTVSIPSVSPPLTREPVNEVVHTSRYTLVSLTSNDALKFPLRQITSIKLKAQKKLTRKDALQAWLNGTGYSLCQPTPDTRQLFITQLPDIQRSMGPIRIEHALQTIIGQAWQMDIDEVARSVCFRLTPTQLS